MQKRVQNPVSEHLRQYTRPSVTVDLVVFTMSHETLNLLLIQRGTAPYLGHWALPGGFVNVGNGHTEQGESIEDAAHRELEEETGLPRRTVYLKQLKTFGAPYRDPRERVITVAWTALVPPNRIREIRGGSDAKTAAWYAVNKLPSLAFDHLDIVEEAIQHLRQTLQHSPVGLELVPEQFTIGELRAVHECILNAPLDKGNFRRQFLRWVEQGDLKAIDDKRKTASKPAQLYVRNR